MFTIYRSQIIASAIVIFLAGVMTATVIVALTVSM